jgi:hypothetical protein
MFLTFPFIDQAIAQACAFCSSFCGMMSEIEIRQRLPDYRPNAQNDALFAVGPRWVRIPVLLMTVFASVVDLLAALEHFRRVLYVCRT